MIKIQAILIIFKIQKHQKKFQKHFNKMEKLTLINGGIREVMLKLIQDKLNSKYFRKYTLNVTVICTTQAWSTKMISLMDGEELSGLIVASMMDNIKMEFHMDSLERLDMMVAALLWYLKMAKSFIDYEKN